MVRPPGHHGADLVLDLDGDDGDNGADLVLDDDNDGGGCNLDHPQFSLFVSSPRMKCSLVEGFVCLLQFVYLVFFLYLALWVLGKGI